MGRFVNDCLSVLIVSPVISRFAIVNVKHGDSVRCYGVVAQHAGTDSLAIAVGVPIKIFAGAEDDCHERKLGLSHAEPTLGEIVLEGTV